MRKIREGSGVGGGEGGAHKNQPDAFKNHVKTYPGRGSGCFFFSPSSQEDTEDRGGFAEEGQPPPPHPGSWGAFPVASTRALTPGALEASGAGAGGAARSGGAGGGCVVFLWPGGPGILTVFSVL